MTNNKLIKKGINLLKKAEIDSAFLDAELIFMFVTQKSREELYLNPNKKIELSLEKKFFNLIKKRIKGLPIAYLVRKKEFFGINFYIDKNVLIPRPDTELLIEETIKIIKKENYKNILEIGTGSGAISISLAKFFPKIKIIATDISKKALKIAEKNAKINKTKNIKFVNADLLNFSFKTPDIIIANLPYLDFKQKNNLIKFEPKIALYAGKNGLEIIQKLIKQIGKIKNKPKYILLEFESKQKKELIKLAKKYLSEYKIKIFKNLMNKSRIIILNNKIKF